MRRRISWSIEKKGSEQERRNGSNVQAKAWWSKARKKAL